MFMWALGPNLDSIWECMGPIWDCMGPHLGHSGPSMDSIRGLYVRPYMGQCGPHLDPRARRACVFSEVLPGDPLFDGSHLIGLVMISVYSNSNRPIFGCDGIFA